jgi:hypothetical protein
MPCAEGIDVGVDHAHELHKSRLRNGRHVVSQLVHQEIDVRLRRDRSARDGCVRARDGPRIVNQDLTPAGPLGPGRWRT